MPGGSKKWYEGRWVQGSLVYSPLCWGLLPIPYLSLPHLLSPLNMLPWKCGPGTRNEALHTLQRNGPKRYLYLRLKVWAPRPSSGILGGLKASTSDLSNPGGKQPNKCHQQVGYRRSCMTDRIAFMPGNRRTRPT